MPYTVLMLLAGLGFALSVMVHVCALLGAPQPLGSATWALHIGIFAVLVPAIILTKRLRRAGKEDFWKSVLQPIPVWLRGAVIAVVVYAMVNFMMFLATSPTGPRAKLPGASAPTAVFRGFSGHWMAFYAIGFVLMYGAREVARRTLIRACPNGHEVPSAAATCPTCGTAMEQPAVP